MGQFIIVLCIALIFVILIIVYIYKKTQQFNDMKIVDRRVDSLANAGNYEMKISFDILPTLTEQENAQLVEIKDKKLLSQIDNVVPGTVQAIASTNAVKNYRETAKSVGQLYQAIIPKGAVLDKSRAMDGAVRGSYRDVANSIKGNANWVPVDNESANKLASASATNAVMNVASMVVGQYYMSQINEQLEDINAGIEKIAGFQQNEFKSKIYTLVAEIQKSSTFQFETLEKDELRKRELTHLKSLEHECAQLLGQANLSILEIAAKKDLGYDAYEKQIGEAEIWFQYQQVLLEVLFKISDLNFALNLGEISRDNSYALYLPYEKQAESALDSLNEWHKENTERLKINIEESKRKRQGIDGFFMGALGFFNDDFNYKKISQKTVEQIEHQAGRKPLVKTMEEKNHYQEDVRLVAKDGKLYYLPEQKTN